MALDEEERGGEVEPAPPLVSRLVLLYGVAIFLAAALLFLVQPMVGRMVLPRFGGSPEVWNTSMVFFQAALLGGYAYAHYSVRWLGLRRQLLVHAAVLLLPVLALPLAVPGWSIPRGGWQSPWLLLLLAGAVGAPFFALATASPLLQRWFAATGDPAADDPYFLYAGSNAGSLLGLLAYPFLVEPLLPLGLQAALWSVGYGAFVLLVGFCAVPLFRDRRETGRDAPRPPEGTASPPPLPPGEGASPSGRDRLFWILCAFVPSSLMLAVTHFLSSEIAAIPLLWVLPLAVYLITYIVAFSRRVPLSTRLASRLLVVVSVGLALTFLARVREPIWAMVVLHLAGLAAAGLLCHGRLAERRPPATHLTEFYLLVALGGVLGGMFNALAAPVLFDDILEYPIVLVLAAFLLVTGRNRDAGQVGDVGDEGEPAKEGWTPLDVLLPVGLALFVLVARQAAAQLPGISDGTVAILAAALPALALYLLSRRALRFALGLGALLSIAFAFPQEQGRELLSERTFFGVSRVVEDADESFRILFHGTTIHGVQSTDPSEEAEALGYYHSSQPGGSFVRSVTAPATSQEVGVVGLGTGALALLAGPEDRVTFYEIDPQVAGIARDPRYFDYLERATAEHEIVLGDGRLALQDTDRRFDLLILDAFSSASVPVHLLTREAVLLYLDRLDREGLLLFHISSRHLALLPVLVDLAGELGLELAEAPPYEDAAGLAEGILPSHWVIMARDSQDFLRYVDRRWRPPRVPGTGRVWTDDYADVLSVYRWN